MTEQEWAVYQAGWVDGFACADQAAHVEGDRYRGYDTASLRSRLAVETREWTTWVDGVALSVLRAHGGDIRRAVQGTSVGSRWLHALIAAVRHVLDTPGIDPRLEDRFRDLGAEPPPVPAEPPRTWKTPARTAEQILSDAARSWRQTELDHSAKQAQRGAA